MIETFVGPTVKRQISWICEKQKNFWMVSHEPLHYTKVTDVLEHRHRCQRTIQDVYIYIYNK